MSRNTLAALAITFTTLTGHRNEKGVRAIRKSSELSLEELRQRNTLFCVRRMDLGDPEETDCPTWSKEQVDCIVDYIKQNDPEWEEYTQSLDSMDLLPENDGGLPASYAAAARMRDSYRRWLATKLDSIMEAHDELMASDDTTWDSIDEFACNNDTSFLVDELERMSSADDSGLNIWGTRPELGDIEFGIVSDEATLDVLADSHEFGDRNQDFQASLGPQLCKVADKRFASKDEAQQFVDRTREAFRKKGDHSAEIIRCETQKGHAEPYVAFVLEADGNWGHRKALAAERDRHMENAIRKAEGSTTRQQLNSIARIAKRYSRDMQVLNNNKTSDGNRKVGIGFNYIRFATVMNAIAARANELGFTGFKTYKIREFESTRKPTDGDMMDVGCAQGEFLGLEKEDDQVTEEALWSQMEGTWKPSCELEASPLVYRNPEFQFGPAALSSLVVVAAA